MGDIKYSYDLSDDEVSVIVEIKQEIMSIRASYDKIVDVGRSKMLAYSKLAREMEIINSKLIKTEEKLNGALKNLGSLKEMNLEHVNNLMKLKKFYLQQKKKFVHISFHVFLRIIMLNYPKQWKQLMN